MKSLFLKHNFYRSFLGALFATFSIGTHAFDSDSTQNEQLEEDIWTIEIYVFEKTEHIDCRYLLQLPVKDLSQTEPLITENANSLFENESISFNIKDVPHDKNFIIFLTISNSKTGEVYKSRCRENIIATKNQQKQIDLYLDN